MGQSREDGGIARPTKYVLASSWPHMGLGPEVLGQGRIGNISLDNGELYVEKYLVMQDQTGKNHRR